MSGFFEVFKNSVIFTAILGWFIAQSLKVILVFLKHKKLDFRRFIGSGGMPSSHSSTVMALSTAIGLTEGFLSNMYAVSLVLALIVMYDAAGVRRAAGQQARILNKIVEEWGKSSFSDTEKKLKELLGHTPVEVLSGAVLGILIAVIRHI
ncbi:MAG: divergent PAP2 family protein [Clostridia bacterium]|nr:divergent PAP2 family protein [Clostridia bacterium]